MKIISTKFLLIISLLVFMFGCENERIASPDSVCDAESFELIIESVQNTACAESSGEIVAIVNGEGLYEYRINNGDFVEGNVFSNLAAGNYSIQAKAVSTNCISEAIEVSIENEDGLQITLVEKNDSECGENTGNILVSQEGGVEPVEYIINSNESQSSPEFTGLSSGEYTVLARDANGCEAEITGIEILSNISFSNDIKQIIATNCAVTGCHSGSQPPNFSVDDNIFQNASSIKARTGSGNMPPAGRPDLTADEIQAIACWVDSGALDN